MEKEIKEDNNKQKSRSRRPPYLPADCFDIANALVRIEHEKVQRVAKEPVTVRKAYVIYAGLDDNNKYHGDCIYAHLAGRKTGAVWLMKIDMEKKACTIYPASEDELRKSGEIYDSQRKKQEEEREKKRQDSGKRKRIYKKHRVTTI